MVCALGLRVGKRAGIHALDPVQRLGDIASLHGNDLVVRQIAIRSANFDQIAVVMVRSAGDSEFGAVMKDSAPLDASIWNLPASSPPTIENASEGPSGSVAVIVVPAVTFSGR